MKYALLGLAFLAACAPQITDVPKREPKDPKDVGIACTRGAADRMALGEPAYSVYKDCTLACKETTDPAYCEDTAKSYIELAQAAKNFKDSMDGL